MFIGAFTLAQTVRAIRVSHVTELLVVFDQFIQQQFGIGVMHIVVAGAMDVQQLSP
jgi:hypothetical protein